VIVSPVAGGVGVGLIDDWSYVEGSLATGETIAPRAQNLPLYDERYAQFLELSDATTDTSHDIARSFT